MNKKRIRALAEERIALGYSRQHILDELHLTHPEIPPERIGRILRYLAPQAVRAHFRPYQQGLLAAVVIAGIVEVMHTVLVERTHAQHPMRWFSFVPIATLFLGYAVYRWRGAGLGWLAVMNGFNAVGLLRSLPELAAGGADAWALARQGLSLLICSLAAYLYFRAFPTFTVIKDPERLVPPRIIFPPEPGMAMM